MFSDLGVPTTGTLGPLSALQYINTAGKMLVNMMGWSWLDRAGTTLDFVASQGYVVLPSDVLRVHSITPAALGQALTLVSFDTWIQYQKQGIQPNGYVGYVGGDVGSGGAYTRRLFLYPTPSANLTGALSMIYRGGWTEILAGDDAGTFIGIPPFMEPLYLEVLRAVAYGYEENDNGSVSQRMEMVKNSRVYKDAVAVDVNSVPYTQPSPSHRQRSYEPNHIYNDLPIMTP